MLIIEIKLEKNDFLYDIKFNNNSFYNFVKLDIKSETWASLFVFKAKKSLQKSK